MDKHREAIIIVVVLYCWNRCGWIMLLQLS